MVPPLSWWAWMSPKRPALAIAVRPTAETWRASNDATGIEALVTRLGALAPP